MSGIPLDYVAAQRYGREHEEMIVQWKICEDFGDKRGWSDVYEFEETLTPKLGTYC